MLVQRHLLSDYSKKNASLVIPWLNFVKFRRGDCCFLIERHSLNHIYIFHSAIGIYQFKYQRQLIFLFQFSIMFFSFDIC